MGQKVNPVGFRIGTVRTWKSQWFSEKRTYARDLLEDHAIRKIVSQSTKDAMIDRVEIQRFAGRLIVSIFTARPGMIIGKGGAGMIELEEKLKKKCQRRVEVKVEEIQKSDLYASLVAEDIARQITARISYRRAAKMAMRRVLEAGGEGVRVAVKGRLNGADIARQEFFTEGQLPLSTLRADVDFATRGAWTSYGQVGVRVWIYRGEKLTGRGSGTMASKEERRRVAKG